MAVIATPLPQRLHNTDRIELNRSSWQAAGLVGWWPLGAYPDARDMSIYRNDSTIVGAPVAGNVARRGLHFDGTTDQINTGPHIRGSLTGEGFFITSWLNPDSVTTSWDSHISFRGPGGGSISGSMIVAYRNDRQIWLYIRDDTKAYVTGKTYTGDVLTAGEWSHVAFGREADGTVKCYIDGIQTAITGTVVGTLSSTESPGIGWDWDVSVNARWDGLLDDVRWYRRALSANEIAAIYNQTRYGGYGDLAIQPSRFHHLPVAAAVVSKPRMTLLGVG